MVSGASSSLASAEPAGRSAFEGWEEEGISRGAEAGGGGSSLPKRMCVLFGNGAGGGREGLGLGSVEEGEPAGAALLEPACAVDVVGGAEVRETVGEAVGCLDVLRDLVG